MDISLSAQALAFVIMVICGALCGVVFDVFRAMRRMHKTAGGVVALQDICFWLLELILVYMAAFYLNYAHIRAYEAVALVIGSWLYFMTASGYVLGFFVVLIRKITKAFAVMAKPISKLFQFLKRNLGKFARYIKANAVQMLSGVKKALKPKQKAKKTLQNEMDVV